MFGFKKKIARASVLVAASAAVMAVSGVGASSASAACGTGELVGRGASLQNVAQKEIWKTAYEGECGSATINYLGGGSGAGLAAWDFTGSAAPIDTATHYTATDDAPTGTQIAAARTSAEATGEAAGETHVVVVPVAQTAIAVMVNVPAKCTLTKINNAALEQAFAGSATTWPAIGATGAECSGTVQRVVRTEGSGTTYQFKNYLSKINSGEPCGADPKKWVDMQEIVGTEGPNVEWPECGGGSPAPIKAAGGSGVATKVATTSGTIGYAALPDARAASAVTIAVENEKELGKPSNWTKPGTTEAATGFANCAAAAYSVPDDSNPTKGGDALDTDWSLVFGGNPTIGGTTYPICTLTYDMAWSSYESAGFAGAEARALYVQDYLTKVVKDKKVSTVGKWYSALPTIGGFEGTRNVQAAAELAATKIKK